MNKSIKLNDLLQAQRELDQLVFNNNGLSNLYNDNEINKKVKIACIVELGEFVNEIEFFKYWKKNKRNNKEKQLDELADVMHFLLSLINTNKTSNLVLYKLKDMTIKEILKRTMNNENKHFYSLENDFFNLLNDINNEFYLSALTTLLSIGYTVGFSCDEMMNAYWRKREVNFNRQKENY